MKIKAVNKMFPLACQQNGKSVHLGNVVRSGFEYNFFPKLQGFKENSLEINFDCNWGIWGMQKYKL